MRALRRRIAAWRCRRAAQSQATAADVLRETALEYLAAARETTHEPTRQMHLCRAYLASARADACAARAGGDEASAAEFDAQADGWLMRVAQRAPFLGVRADA